MSDPSDTRLSRTVTVARYRQLEASADRAAIAAFIEERFTERYFSPFGSHRRCHGFVLMSLSCLLIETLEAFRRGLPTSDGHGPTLFKAFFERHHRRGTPLGVFPGADRRPDWFYKDIRCGLLHEAESRAGWRIRKGSRHQLLDSSNRTINAERFFEAVRADLLQYCNELRASEWDGLLWRSFRTKMKRVCANCSPPHPSP